MIDLYETIIKLGQDNKFFKYVYFNPMDIEFRKYVDRLKRISFYGGNDNNRNMFCGVEIRESNKVEIGMVNFSNVAE